jgi:hypothetical protein
MMARAVTSKVRFPVSGDRTQTTDVHDCCVHAKHSTQKSASKTATVDTKKLADEHYDDATEQAGKEAAMSRGRRNSTSLFRLARSKVPEYLREPFVFSYYRREGLAYYQCFCSLFKMHNETFNCWTHYVGFVLFISLAISVMCGGTPLPVLNISSGPHLSDSVAAHRIHLQVRKASEMVCVLCL